MAGKILPALPEQQEDRDDLIVDGETGEVVDRVSSDAEIVTKISISAIGGNPALAKAAGKRVPVAAVWGRATGVRQSTDSKGEVMVGNDGNPLLGLVGAFRAINLQSGHEFMSSVLYLHTSFQKLVEDKIEAIERKRGAGGFKGVEFEFQIDAVPAQNPAGYSYVYRSLMPVEQRDPLEHMTAHVRAAIEMQAQLALPAA